MSESLLSRHSPDKSPWRKKNQKTTINWKERRVRTDLQTKNQLSQLKNHCKTFFMIGIQKGNRHSSHSEPKKIEKVIDSWIISGTCGMYIHSWNQPNVIYVFYNTEARSLCIIAKRIETRTSILTNCSTTPKILMTFLRHFVKNSCNIIIVKSGIRTGNPKTIY